VFSPTVPPQEITVNANVTRLIAIEHSADLQRAARHAQAARDDEPARQPRRTPRLMQLRHLRRTRLSGRLATSPESCDA
jgi:hypothetical protein